jgi:outer membrane biosynthesis protein TonB
MSDHERGAYTPPTADAPLSFDPRQPVRGARPIPFTLILSVLVLAALVAAIFVFYQSGVRQAGEAPPAVGEPVAGIKSAAPAGAQPQDPAAGLQIYRSDEGQPMETVAPTFTPEPEQPQARPTPKVVVTQAPPVQAAPAPSAATSQALKPAIAAAPVQKITPPPAPVQKVAAAPPAPKPAPPPVQKTAPAPTPEPKAVASGGAVVQIGAVSSTALADKAWNDAVAVAPGMGVGKGKSVQKIEKNGGTLYRTAVTGFASKADAQAFCAKLQASGKSCFVR